MRRTIVTVLAAWCLVCVVGSKPAGAVVNTYRQILAGATRAVATAPGAIYAGVAGGVKKSVDGGATWTHVLSSTQVNGLAVDPKSPGTVYAATAAGLLRSVDGGQSWTGLNSAVRNFVAVSPFDSNVLFGDRFKSVDGGASWRAVVGLPLTLDPSFHIALSADPAIPGFMLASVHEQSYRSVDGGETWQFFWQDVDSVAIDPADARYYYLGGRCGDQIRRYFPGPTGAPTTAYGGPDHVHGIVVDPTSHARVFAVTDDSTAAVSANFGAAWRTDANFGSFYPAEGRIAFDAATGMVLVPGSNGLWAVNSWCADADNDGYSAEGGLCGPLDCDDASPVLNPKVREDCWDGIDNNCNGALDMSDAYCVSVCSDKDQDGFLSRWCRGLDCDDANATIFPGAPEICDWRDNDCDGGYDEDQADLDGDGYATCSDCDDADAAVFPYAVEVPFDGVDQDCDGYDLTLEVTLASYSPEQHGALHVRAQSAYGADAGLWVGYYGSMVWKEKKGYWEFVMTGIGDHPGIVTICGNESCVEAPVK